MLYIYCYSKDVALTGYEWVMELLTGHDGRCHKNLRMESNVFLKLCGELVNKYNFKVPTKGLTMEESVATFLYTIGKRVHNRDMQERF